MGEKAQERPHPMHARGNDPRCNVCHPTQPGRVRHDQVWAWSRAHPGESPWREPARAVTGEAAP